MSKKNQKHSQEIPQIGNTPEVPDYVNPATDLEYREFMDEVDPRNTDRSENCKTDDCRN